MELRNSLCAAALGIAVVTGMAVPGGGAGAQEEEEEKPAPIKVGILHSLYGEMSVSETSLKDVVRMLIQRQNARGGLLGRPIEAVINDPASDPVLAAQLARQMIEEDGVAVIFGCWVSECRKAVRPVVEQLNSLLFYPVQYEGQESSRNIIYTGATPNQQALPAVDYLVEAHGVERWVLLGSDYVYSRKTNTVLTNYLTVEKGVRPDDILERYSALGQTEWQETVSELKALAAEGSNTAVVSTITGEANLYFYKELGKEKVRSRDIPVLALSVGEEELAGIDTTQLVGHMAARNYFMTVDNAFNRAFINMWQNFARNPRRVTKDAMEAHFIGFALWVKAVEAAGTIETRAVLEQMIGLSTDNLSGGKATVLPNHHLAKPAFIGEIQRDGRFEVVWRSPELIEADAWSDYYPGSGDLIADWRPPISCGRYNESAGVCEDSAVGE